MKHRLTYASVIVALCFTTTAEAQCRWDSEFSTLPGPNGPVSHLFVWDPDGPGPTPERLVVRGSFTQAGDALCPGFAMYDGTRFEPLASPAGTVGGPIGAVGSRLYAAFTTGAQSQVWYWDDSGLHLESDVPAGGTIHGVARSQVYGVVNNRLSTLSQGAFTPFADPVPPDASTIATDGHDFVASTSFVSTYRLVGTQWQAVAGMPPWFNEAVPYGGGVIWHYYWNVVGDTWVSDLSGAIAGQFFWGVSGTNFSPSARLISAPDSTTVHVVPRQVNQGLDVTRIRLRAGASAPTIVDVSEGEVACAVRFRGRWVIGGDFAECDRAGPYLALQTPSGWESPVSAPLGQCTSITTTPAGTVYALWSRPLGWYGPFQSIYERSEAGWARFQGDYSDPSFPPRLYCFGPYVALWANGWRQRNGPNWDTIPLTGVLGVPHGDLLVPQFDGTHAWNGTSLVHFPPLATARVRVSINGSLFGNLYSNGQWARLEGTQWQALGPDPTGGRDLTTFRGMPAGVANDGTVRVFSNGEWSALGHSLLSPPLRATLAEWNGALYVAGAAIHCASGTTTLARWNGQDWIPVPGAPSHPITSLSPSPEGLWIAGEFVEVDGVPTRGVARLLSPCPADIDCSGGVDADDTTAFFGAWDASTSAADMNRDGAVDGDDVIAFFIDLESGSC